MIKWNLIPFGLLKACLWSSGARDLIENPVAAAYLVVLALFGAGLAYLLYVDTQAKAKKEAAFQEQREAAMMLREQGYICHEEVVLPVVSNGYFVGHNRIDILVHRTHGATGKAYYVAAIELKTLRDSLHCRERAHEVEQQTRGYMRCLRSVFASSRVFHVFTVNFRRAESGVEVLSLEEKRPIKT